jgi:hypothetical protein
VAQSTDLLTIEDALMIVRRSPSNTIHQPRLEQYVSAVSQRLDELVGPIVQRTITGEQIEVGCGSVRLRRWPVTSITSVTVWSQGVSEVLTAETLAASGGYRAERWADDQALLSGRLSRRSNWSDSPWSHGSTVVVTYVAGRYATTAAVKGTRYWQAAALTLKSVWRAEESTTQVIDEYELSATAIPGFMVPNTVKELLADQIQYTGVG